MISENVFTRTRRDALQYTYIWIGTMFLIWEVSFSGFGDGYSLGAKISDRYVSAGFPVYIGPMNILQAFSNIMFMSCSLIIIYFIATTLGFYTSSNRMDRVILNTVDSIIHLY